MLFRVYNKHNKLRQNHKTSNNASNSTITTNKCIFFNNNKIQFIFIPYEITNILLYIIVMLLSSDIDKIINDNKMLL